MVPLQVTGNGAATVEVIGFPQASLTVGGVGCTAFTEQLTVVPPSAGTVKSGVETVIICNVVAVLPQASVATKVLVTV